MSLIKSSLGKISLLIQRFLLSSRLRNIIYFSDVNINKHGLHLPFDLLKDTETKVDISILYPDTISQNSKKYFNQLGRKLSEKNKVLVREVIIEAGGGEESIFPPIVNVVSSFLLELIIKKIYKEVNNPVTKSQFVIRRINNGIRYNYVFDKLKPDDAIKASKIIPSVSYQKGFPDKVFEYYHDIYLRFELRKSIWIKI